MRVYSKKNECYTGGDQETFCRFIGGGLILSLKRNSSQVFSLSLLLFYFLRFSLLTSLTSFPLPLPFSLRDLKCENILIDQHNNITIIDFGLSCLLSSHHPNNTLCCGTPAYMAPEMLKKTTQKYGSEVDIWSLGVSINAHNI